MSKSLKFMYHFMTAVCGVAALLSGTRLFYFFFIALLTIRIISWRLAKHYKENIFLRSSAKTDYLTSGDVLELSYKLTNTSLLPLWHGRIDFTLPDVMQSDSLRNHGVFLGPQETLPFTEVVLCPLRGYYAIGATQISVSDPMGFHSYFLKFDKTIAITVFPRVNELPQMLFAPRSEGGNFKANDRSFDDRTHLMNLRDYVVGDDIKNIHWKLSAKKEKLVLREFHKSLSEQLTVLLDGFYGNWGGGFNALEEERMVSFCASYIKGTLLRGLDFTLLVNNEASDQIRGDRPEVMSEVMALLTSFRSDSGKRFEDFLQLQLEKSALYEHVVFIVPRATASLMDFIGSLNVTYDLYALRIDPEVIGMPYLKLIESLEIGRAHV